MKIIKCKKLSLKYSFSYGPLKGILSIIVWHRKRIWIITKHTQCWKLGGRSIHSADFLLEHFEVNIYWGGWVLLRAVTSWVSKMAGKWKGGVRGEVTLWGFTFQTNCCWLELERLAHGKSLTFGKQIPWMKFRDFENEVLQTGWFYAMVWLLA